MYGGSGYFKSRDSFVGVIQDVMKQRNLAFVYFMPMITLGVYAIVWWVKTKNEMVRLGASVPTAWLLIVPVAGLYWLYTYYRAAEKITGGRSRVRPFSPAILY